MKIINIKKEREAAEAFLQNIVKQGKLQQHAEVSATKEVTSSQIKTTEPQQQQTVTLTPKERLSQYLQSIGQQ